jgi:hypothetical protein
VLASGNIKIGVNPYGGLIVDTVGLRRTDSAQSEVLAHDCACEGWGIRGANAGSPGGAYTSFNKSNSGLTSTFFSATSSTASSRTEISGAVGLGITHQFTPSSHPDLYRVDVAVTNTSVTTWSDVHYRRAFDWDVDPTPFTEYVTWGKRPSAPDAFVNYTSNDGFAFPDPDLPLSHLGSEGYFTDAGPRDHGGLIDITLGDIAPFTTKRFTFYYGVSTTEAAALSAIDAVGAQVYSLGQPNVTGAAETGSPITAIFAIDGSDLTVPVETLSADSSTEMKSPWSPPESPPQQPHGVRGVNQQAAP